ncbi:MAG: hypothetical protein SFU25_10265 [Candidatus Caenarcaniphilales bacterium]|nr:hypothetical protein [Candidatus Caenarcaniphilales bacterium]
MVLFEEGLPLLKTQSALHQSIKELIVSGSSLSEAEFNGLALALYSHQFEHNPTYQRLCRTQGLSKNIEAWQQIPLVTTELYKSSILFSKEETQAAKLFFSSGTTQENKSKHFLSEPELELYELSLWKSFSQAFLLEKDLNKFDYFVLSESAQEKPNSSLIHMFECIRLKLNAPKNCYYFNDSHLQQEALLKNLEQSIENQKPVLMVGSAFAFLQLIQSIDKVIILPKGSALMETGGFKGQHKEIPKAEFYEMLQQKLSLSQHSIVGQYGMSELNSQFYDSCFRLNSNDPQTRWKQALPWCRVRIVDPQDPKRKVQENESGLIAFYDLSNFDSCGFILTGDLGIKRSSERFELIGRASNLLPKGCSLNYEI